MKISDQDSDLGPRSPLIPFRPGSKRVQSLALFRGHREIVIVHQGAEYRLRITKGDKLILTK